MQQLPVNAGFTLGGLSLANKTFTLGSATTDLTLFDNSSTNTSPPGTLATKLADFTVTSSDATDITTGTTITSTGGKFSFANGIKMNGATISLDDTTLAVGESLTKTGGTLTLNQADLELTSDLTLNSDAAMAFDTFTPNAKDLELASGSTAEVSLGNLNIASSSIDVKGGTLNITGGSVGANGSLEIGGSGTLKLGGNLDVTGTINLNNGATTTFAGNKIDVSGGTLAGRHTLPELNHN